MSPMSEVSRDPVDAAAREGAIAAQGSVLVQAPAGSGKTTLLVQRYLRLLATVDAPERILALTFTRRAAQEMRQRVLAALGAANLADCPPEMNPRTWSLAAAANQRMQSLNCELQSQPSRLRIETIDAFNSWLANQLPVAAGAGAGLRMLTDARPHYEDAARRALAHEGGDRFALAVDRVLELDDQRWRKLVKLIADMLPSRDRWLPLLAGRLQAASALTDEQLLKVRRHFDEDLRLLVGRVLLRAQEVLGSAICAALSSLMYEAARRLDESELLAVWRLDGNALRADADDAARWRCMAILLTTGRALRRTVTKAQGFPPGCADKQPMLDLLERLADDPRILEVILELRTLPDPAYSDAAWARVREVAQVLVLAAGELDGVFREQGAVDFPAVSLGALRALGADDAPTDLALRLDYRMQHILVDEFQDTSSAQLQLVRQLTGGWQADDGRSIFCVGDPMQSIYGFRQAEVRAFLELAEEGIGAVRFDLRRLRSNFRSAPQLVAWNNRCFARLMPQTDDRNRGAIAFRPSEAAVPSTDAADCGVECRGFMSRAAESAAIAEMIAAELARNPGSHIAVLVRARSHAREIAAGLRVRDIVFRAVDIEPLHERAVVRDIIMLSCALLHLGDRVAWLGMLRAPWAGLKLDDVLRVSRAPSLVWDAIGEESLLLTLSAEGRARCAWLRRVLQSAFQVRNDTSLSRWVERTWLNLGGPAGVTSGQELQLAGAAFARLRVLEERGMPDAADLRNGFADLFADHGGASTVEIMTIHKAKGLEFDMVVLPALDRPVPPDRSQLLLSHQFARTGRDGMVMAARPPVGAESDTLFEFLRAQRRDAAVLEAQRLLYVACTRAKCRLRLTAVIGNEESAEDLGEQTARKQWRPGAGSLLRVLWPVVAAEFELPPRQEGPQELPANSAPRGGPLRRLPPGWSPGLLFAARDIQVSSAPPAWDQAPIFDWAGETARRVGNLVHAELQAMDVARLDAAAIRARSGHFAHWFALHGLPADRVAEATARVVQALLGVHGDPRGQWILKSGYRDDFREHALSGYRRGQATRVVFDRSFIDDAGIRWVIDYKTSQHLGSGIEPFLDREVDRYRAQLERYARVARRLGPEPVRVGLYFPLMRAWREWSPPEEVD
ncbi:MAG TPA: UvrD-helicase domain-containing protein [Steroidobacteraceae bacterium]|jgi:ATP-dependent exoDNAse (exonuclease V) beta subunit|nr:UvrD-helicase domain-containing protein [Steroidobacteraceae bacterium]